MHTYSPALYTLSPQILGISLDQPHLFKTNRPLKIIKIRGYPVIKGIHYSDTGWVDVWMGSLRLRASNSTPIVQ